LTNPEQYNEVVYSFLAATLLLVLLVVFIVLFALLFQRRQFQFRRERQALRERFEREILQSRVEIQDHTLRQVGQELHDHVGQALSVMKLQLGVLDEKIGDETHRAALRRTLDTLRTTIHDVRTLSKSLDIGTVQRFGLPESLAQELERIGRTGRFETHLHTEGTPYPLGTQAETVLFRLAQEALQNAIKHSGGRVLTVALAYEPGDFGLTVADDGLGFDFPEVEARSLTQSGAGLHNLRQRASLLGGTCTFRSQPGAGTRVEVRIPRPPSARNLP